MKVVTEVEVMSPSPPNICRAVYRQHNYRTIVWSLVKINKNQEKEREVEGEHHNGHPASNGVNGSSGASSGEVEAKRAGRRKVRTEDCEVTGQAIQPRRRGRGGGRLGRSATAPSTPVRTRAANLRTNSLEQTKSLEVRQPDIAILTGLSNSYKYRQILYKLFIKNPPTTNQTFLICLQGP